MKPTTRDSKLTHKQWAALWQIEFGFIQTRVMTYYGNQITKSFCDGRDVSSIMSILANRGMARLDRKKEWRLTQRGHEYL